jgi:molybdenum cofactor biosynthesis enzyme MoaA
LNTSRHNAQSFEFGFEFRSKDQLIKLSQAVRWLQEWPTIEELIYVIYPAIRQTQTATMPEVIEYMLEELDSCLIEDPYQLPPPRRRDRDAATMKRQLAQIFHWFDQWEVIEEAIYEACPDINRTLVHAFGRLLPCLARELSVAVQLYHVRKHVRHMPLTA